MAIQVLAVGGKGLDVAGDEETVVGIEQFQVAVEYLLGQFVVEARVLVVPVGQELGGQVAAQPLVQAGLEQDVLGRLGGGPDRRGDE